MFIKWIQFMLMGFKNFWICLSLSREAKFLQKQKALTTNEKFKANSYKFSSGFFLKYIFLPYLFCFPAWTDNKSSQPFPLNKALIKKLKKQGNSLISDRVGEYILRAENLAENKKYDKAIELLEFHYNRADKTEKATFSIRLAYLYRQIKNNKKALKYFQTALDSKALNYEQHLSTLYYLSQIFIEEEKYDKALEFLKQWFSINEKPQPSAYILLAHYYYAKNQISLALKYIEKTLSLTTQPKESWLEFAVAIYLKKANYKKAKPYLEKLTALYPTKARHWKQLAGVYLHLDNLKKAFITLDLADKMGHLKNKSEYLNLISLYIEQGLPYQGAQILQKKMKQNIIPSNQKNLELMAQAFYLARERKKSLNYLKKASKTATNSKFFLNYGQGLLDQEEWATAEQIFKKALQTKDIKETIDQIEKYKKSLKNNAISPFEKNNNYSNELPIENQKNTSAQPEKIIKTDKEIQSRSEKTINANEEIKTQEKEKIDKQEKAPSTNNLEHIYLGIGIALYYQKKYEEALVYLKKSIEAKDTFLSGYQWIDYTEKSLQEQQQEQSVKKTQ